MKSVPLGGTGMPGRRQPGLSPKARRDGPGPAVELAGGQVQLVRLAVPEVRESSAVRARSTAWPRRTSTKVVAVALLMLTQLHRRIFLILLRS